MTPAELARCRKAWDTATQTRGLRATAAAALWALEWGDRLLGAAAPTPPDSRPPLRLITADDDAGRRA